MQNKEYRKRINRESFLYNIQSASYSDNEYENNDKCYDVNEEYGDVNSLSEIEGELDIDIRTLPKFILSIIAP